MVVFEKPRGIDFVEGKDKSGVAWHFVEQHFGFDVAAFAEKVGNLLQNGFRGLGKCDAAVNVDSGFVGNGVDARGDDVHIGNSDAPRAEYLVMAELGLKVADGFDDGE